MSAQLGRGLQEILNFMDRNDPTMTRACTNTCGESAAADGAAQRLLLQCCRCRMGHVYGVDCVCATQKLYLLGNEVTDAGAEAIARALEKNTTVTDLNLGCEFVVCEVFGLWG
jgi:hypothetical protein